MEKENIMQKTFVFSVALLFFGTSAMSTINGHTPQPTPILGTTLYVGGVGGGNYSTIQDAIDDASDGYKIIVYPGTYNEDQITVDKALIIQGAGYASTIIDGSDATLASCGLVRIIASGDVAFKGFTVQNAGGPPDGGDYGDDLLNVGIYTESSSSSATYTISDNKVLGTNNPDDYEDYGLYAYSGQEHLNFSNNIVTQTAANSLLIEKHLGSTRISYNTLDAGCWGIDPIYCMTYDGTDITTLQKIDNNTIDVSTGVNPHGSGDNKVTAMGFSSAFKGGPPYNIDDSGMYTNIEISNNTINNLQAYERGVALDNFAWGDGSGGEISGAVIKDNVFNGISNEASSFGIRLSGLISGTVVKRNTITGCDKSFYGTSDFYGDGTAYPTNTDILQNNFVGNGEGLVWDGTDQLVAENNWWGSTSGPQASGNPDGTGDPISGDVDYTPWLLHPFDNSPPVFGTPSPANGSTGLHVSFTWSIPISDPDGDLFSWTIHCSNGYQSSGSGASNGTKSLALSGLAYSTTYKVWVNATDPLGSNLYTRKWYTFQTKADYPPVFGTPSPSNGSTGQPLSLTWSIPINDPDGDSFSWTIQCSNGQTNSGSGASNGTKSLALSGLSYYKTYKVWVNATDPFPPGSGLYTKRWYVFTTKQSQPPVFGAPSPSNNSYVENLSFTWSIPISDPEGDLFSWTIQCNNSEGSSGTSASNGTKSLALFGLAYDTTYKVWVNATDPLGSGQYTRKWYQFTTVGNSPPVFGTPSPANGSTGLPLSFTWSILINDPDGDSFDWAIQCNNSQASGAIGDSNGTKSLALSGLAYNTTYKVWVNATDPDGSGLTTRMWYEFTTKIPDNPPNVPGDPNPPNGATNINVSTTVLSWTGGDPDPGDTVTYDVYFGTTNPPANVIHNQSATSYDPGTLTYHTTYYWQIIARDNQGLSTAGPIWKFKTEFGPDTIPPYVKIKYPVEGDLNFNYRDVYLYFHFIMTIVFGKYTVLVNAYDNESGIEKVEFWVDSQLRHTDNQSPYNWTWSEKGIYQHTLRVVAYDNAGNHAEDAMTLWKVQVFG